MITRGIRNNNPFNIKISGNRWIGKVKKSENTDGTFEQFISMKYGLRAGIHLLKNYFYKHDIVRLEDYIKRFAPSSENDTDKYINFVVCFICSNYVPVISSDEVLPDTSLFWCMLQAMLIFESNYEVSVADLIKADKYV